MMGAGTAIDPPRKGRPMEATIGDAELEDDVRFVERLPIPSGD
jgi:hypothetical protein